MRTRATASKHPALRPDLALVAEQIPDGSRVLDLGCGSGSLLQHVIAEHGCTGTGVEIDDDKVLAAIRRGVPIIDMNVDVSLDQFADDSYDICVLSRTLQSMLRPEYVLTEMGRIADTLIVSVPNFGWWRHRVRLMRGRMPMGKDLPYRWYNSPNIRYTTLLDLEDLFDSLGLTIVERYHFGEGGRRLTGRVGRPNLMASAGVYVLRPGR